MIKQGTLIINPEESTEGILVTKDIYMGDTLGDDNLKCVGRLSMVAGEDIPDWILYGLEESGA